MHYGQCTAGSLLEEALLVFPQDVYRAEGQGTQWRYILYTVHCTLYDIHCTLYTVYCTLYTVYQTTQSSTLYSIKYSAHYITNAVHCTLHTGYRIGELFYAGLPLNPAGGIDVFTPCYQGTLFTVQCRAVWCVLCTAL